jgi:hypothetical protein
MNWNGSLQRELTANLLLELLYQASAGVGLVERWEVNTFPIDFAEGNEALRQAVFAVPQRYRPWPHFGSIRFRSNFGHSTYHSGAVKLEKRYSRGLTFLTFYEFSKAINSQDNDNDGSGVAPIQNRSLEKARAGYDRNHRSVTRLPTNCQWDGASVSSRQDASRTFSSADTRSPGLTRSKAAIP